MPQTLQELIQDTGELRSLPATTARLLELLDDATAGADEVLTVIATDPSLLANLLKLCNSAYYGLRRQVGSAREALVMLGNRTVVNLAFATSMGGVLRGPLAGYHLGRDALWHHAMGTAVGAAFLAGRWQRPDLRETAFTGGLVHDIGKLLLNGPLKDNLTQLPPGADSAALAAAEREILGWDHAAAGAALAEAWNFPAALVELIRQHPVGPAAREWESATDADLVRRAVAVANAVSGTCGFGGGTVPLDDAGLAALQATWQVAATDTDALRERLPNDLDALLGVIGEQR